jgi:uncharacterized protein YcbK (DUF882 family)
MLVAAWHKDRGALIAAFALACALVVAITTVSLAAETAPESSRLEAIAVRGPDVRHMPSSAAIPSDPLPECPRLRIEYFDGSTLVDVVPFDREGNPDPKAMKEISRALATRDGHRVEVHPRLVELLVTMSQAFDGKPIVLVSGYREPGRGTRKTSYHVAGMAADIAIRGVKVHELRKAAIRLGAGGVGLYPYYLHVDVRQDAPHRWGGGSWRRWRR